MTDIDKEAATHQIQTIMAHLASQLEHTRTVYLKALDNAMQFVIDEATSPGSATRLAPPADFLGLPDEQIMARFESDGHLSTWVIGRTEQQTKRLNRSDLVHAAARLGLLDAMPELKGKGQQ